MKYKLWSMCVFIPILVTTFPEWLSGTEPCRKHPAPCVRPRCVFSVLRAHVQFCRFDKADATADVQWHCNHRPPLWYHYFPAQSSLGADILVCSIGKIVRTCAPGGSRTLDFPRARRAPYPLDQSLRFCEVWHWSINYKVRGLNCKGWSLNFEVCSVKNELCSMDYKELGLHHEVWRIEVLR